MNPNIIFLRFNDLFKDMLLRGQASFININSAFNIFSICLSSLVDKELTT